MSEVPIPELPKKPAREGGRVHRLQAALALVTAFSAIALAIWEGAENRRHNRLGVQPRLDAAVESGRDGSGEYVRMAVENTGLGPAVIQTFRIYFDGVPQDTITTPRGESWRNVIEAFSTNGTQINARGFGSGYYFPAGRQQVLFEARRLKVNPEGEAALADILNRLALQICYCSIYNTDCGEVLLTTTHLNAQSCAR